MTFTSIQGYRFIAAILVLLFHLKIMDSGYKGVDLFFVISGFVIYYSTINNKADNRIKKQLFVINRLTKIFILYWSSLLVMFIIKPFNLDINAIGAIFLIPGHKTILGVSWSLSYELYFYFLIFLLLLNFDSKYEPYIFWALLLISTITTILLPTKFTLKGTWLTFFAGQNLWEFLLGILAAKILLRVSVYNILFLFSLLFISFFLFITISITYNSPVSQLVYGFLSFGIITSSALIEKKYFKFKKQKNTINTLGEASYAIYLFSPIMVLLLPQFGVNNELLTVCIVITVSLFISLFYETPLLRLVRKKIMTFFQMVTIR